MDQNRPLLVLVLVRGHAALVLELELVSRKDQSCHRCQPCWRRMMRSQMDRNRHHVPVQRTERGLVQRQWSGRLRPSASSF